MNGINSRPARADSRPCSERACVRRPEVRGLEGRVVMLELTGAAREKITARQRGEQAGERPPPVRPPCQADAKRAPGRLINYAAPRNAASGTWQSEHVSPVRYSEPQMGQ